MRVLVGYTNHIPQVAEGRGLPGRHLSGDSILAFGAGYTGMNVTPDMGWADILARCPRGWHPDVYIHWSPEYNPIPAGLETADCLTVGVWGDWNLGGQAMRGISSLFDVLAADTAGCERLRGMGFANVLHGLLWAFDPAKHRRLGDAPEVENTRRGAQASGDERAKAPCRDTDILMIGNFNHAVQWERAPWLARVAALSDRYKVLVTSGLYDDAYVNAMNRAKIVFNRSIRGEANMRAYEAPACGALMFYEAANREIRDVYTDREHCVLYDDATLESLLAYYLAPENEAERLRIAQAGWERAQAHSYAHHFADLLSQIEPLLSGRSRTFDRLPAAQQQVALAAHWLLTCNVSVYHRADAVLNALGSRAAGLDIAGQRDDMGARIANLHAVLCGEIARCAASPAYKRQCGQAALQRARQAVHLAPDNVIARFNLAYLTLDAGSPTQAETLLRDLAAQLDRQAKSNTRQEADDAARTRSDGAARGAADQTQPAATALCPLAGPTFPRRFDWFDVALERLYGEHAPDSPEGHARLLRLLTGRLHLTLAERAYGRGQFDPSAGHAERAANALPGIGEAQYALALALRAQGRADEAIAAYRRALALAPFHVAARDELARLLLDTERAGEAVQALDAWRAILNGCPVYADQLARTETLRRQALRQQKQEQQRRQEQSARQAGAQRAGANGNTDFLREKRLLALPDWSRAQSWQRVVRWFAQAYTPADPVLLLLRADPTDCPDARALLARLEQFLLNDLHCDADRLPNITLLSQPLAPADGWKLLRVADVVLSENLTAFWRGLAQSACVPILACEDLECRAPKGPDTEQARLSRC